MQNPCCLSPDVSCRACSREACVRRDVAAAVARVAAKVGENVLMATPSWPCALSPFGHVGLAKNQYLRCDGRGGDTGLVPRVIEHCSSRAQDWLKLAAGAWGNGKRQTGFGRSGRVQYSADAPAGSRGRFLSQLRACCTNQHNPEYVRMRQRFPRSKTTSAGLRSCSPSMRSLSPGRIGAQSRLQGRSAGRGKTRFPRCGRRCLC